MSHRRHLRRDEDRNGVAADNYMNVPRDEQVRIRRERFQVRGLFTRMSVWERVVVLATICVFIWGSWHYYSSYMNKSIRLNRQQRVLGVDVQALSCDESYHEEVTQFPGCAPKHCGRYVTDTLVTEREIQKLLGIAKRGIALGHANGGVAVLDLHTGSLTDGVEYVNIYRTSMYKSIFDKADLVVYNAVKAKLHKTVCALFDIKPESLFFSYPTYFSQLNSSDIEEGENIYWTGHTSETGHVSTFHYTTLLYLSKPNGGHFIWVDDIGKKPSRNITLEPHKGRVIIFTMGPNNMQYVEEPAKGIRYAFTVAFTCDVKQRLPDTYMYYT